MTPDETKKEVLERLRSWKDKKAELHLNSCLDATEKRTFQLVVTVFHVADDHSSITLDWHRLAFDPSDHFLFAETKGRWDIFLAGATFQFSNSPKPSVTISRGPFKAELTEIRASAFE